MNNNEFENTIFQVLNVKNGGEITVVFENFIFDFFVVKQGATLDTKINTKNGYIECTNKNGQFLYIYCGAETFPINRSINSTFRSNFYFISNGPFTDLSLSEFSFRFSGGVINKIFPPHALEIDSNEKDKIVINKRKYNMNIEMKVLKKDAKLQFYSQYHYGISIDKGVSISETDSGLDVIGDFIISDLFAIESELSNVFSFMSYRKIDNNYKIELLLDTQVKQRIVKRPVATCYYRSFSSNNKNVDKSFMNLITMYKIREDRFVKLYEIINNKEKDNGFNIDFIPEEGRVNIVDKIRVKETVTAIECLLNKYKIHSKNSQTEDLIEEVKKKVDDYNDNNVDKEIREQIKTSLGYANYPLKKRIYELYKSEEHEIDGYLKWLKERYKYDFSDINDFIKKTVDYRNNHTHDSFGIIDEKILNAVQLFNAMIYSKVLKEIGLQKENISDWLICCLV